MTRRVRGARLVGMGYCIMRTRKLKTDGNVGASLAHAWRDRETPNADQSRTPANQHSGAISKADALAKYRALLPDKVRKNGVRCIEYLITASPDALKSTQALRKYYADAVAWLQAKHGRGLFYAGLHMDEKTPHLYAYAVPIDGRGRLNCRAFLGGREKLSALQDEFYEAVGKPSGLERGVRGSRAKHQEVKRFYSLVAEVDRLELPAIDVPRPPRLGAIFDLDHWQKVVGENITAELKPAFAKAKATALEGSSFKARARSMERVAATTNAENQQLRQRLAATQDALLSMPLEEIQAMRQAKERQKPRRSMDRG